VLALVKGSLGDEAAVASIARHVRDRAPVIAQRRARLRRIYITPHTTRHTIYPLVSQATKTYCLPEIN
jgi:hypothetical protein